MTDKTPGELTIAAESLRAAKAHIPLRLAEPLADWLSCLAMLDRSDRDWNGHCGWCGHDHALVVALAINGPQ